MPDRGRRLGAPSERACWRGVVYFASQSMEKLSGSTSASTPPGCAVAPPSGLLLGSASRGRHVSGDEAAWLSVPIRCARARGASLPASRAGQRGGLEPAGGQGSRLGALLPRALGARQGGALDPRRELHGLVLVERLREGRADHLGVPGGRLSVDGRGDAGVRAARLPAGSFVLLVSVLAAAAEVPVRAREPAGDVSRGAGAAGRPGRRLGGDRRGSRRRCGCTAASGARAGSCGPPGTRSWS